MISFAVLIEPGSDDEQQLNQLSGISRVITGCLEITSRVFMVT